MTDEDLDQIIMAIAAAGTPFRGSNVEARAYLRTAVGTGLLAFTGIVPERAKTRGKPVA